MFNDGPEVLGFLLPAVGIGGGIVIAFMSRMERRGLVQLACLFFISLSLTGFGFSTTLPVALPLLAIADFFEMVFLTTNQTLPQLSIPDDLRRRVTSIVNLNAGLMPLGGLLAGAGSDLLGGPKIIIVIFGVAIVVIAVAIFIGSPTIRNYRLSQAIASAPAK